MKKIMHFVTTSEANGLEHVVMDICNLVKGYEHFYVSPSGEIDEYLRKYNIKHVVVKKVTPHTVKKIVKKYKPDVVNGHDVKASLCLALNSRFCKKNKIKIVSVLHNDDFRMHHRGLRSVLYNLSSKYYDYIVGVSADVINNYIYNYNIDNKSVIIDNIVNPNVINNLSKEKSEVLSDIIFVGRLEEQKNPQLFIKIVKQVSKKIPDIKALMLGNGSLKAKITDIISKENLENNIELIGFKTNPYKYINSAKIMITPSRYEGFGIVALESLILGKPVVCTKVTGLKDIVDNHCGFVSNNFDQLSNAVINLLLDKDLYLTASRNAKKRGREFNNVKKFVQKYSNLYN